MTTILGLNFGHDGSAAIVKNGRLHTAISRERLTRIKKDRGVDLEMINYVLEASNTKLDDVDCIGFSSYIFHPEHLEKDSEIQLLHANGSPVRNDQIHLLGGVYHRAYKLRIGQVTKDAYLVQHHLAHIAAAFFTSNFEKAAALSVDASGVHPEYCSLFAYGIDNKLYYMHCPGIMVGNLYSVFTEKLGMGPGLTKAGTTMAVASMGTPLPYVQYWKDICASYYHRTFQESEMVYINAMWSRLTSLPPHISFKKQDPPLEVVCNHAASLQFMFEQALIQSARQLHSLTKTFNDNNLILAGGSFLNSDANMKIYNESEFEKIFLFPACGDDGTAVGSALYLTHQLLDHPREDYEYSDIMYLGKDYQIDTPSSETIHTAASMLHEGKILAWFQGRSEFGPRALGNRSILGNPTRHETKDIINSKVKHRESFRPFAPVVLAEKTQSWFDIPFESKLMLFISEVKKPELVPAICHVDNSARMQSVSADDNPSLYSLLQAYESISEVPILLNTSLNDNGEPLVETQQEARNLFEKVDLDALIVGDEIILKN